MRIGVNTRMLIKDRMEGICRYIHENLKIMVEQHPEDEFYFFFDRPFHPSFVYSENVHPIVLPPPTRDPILWKIWFDYVVPRAIKKHQIDVFFSPDNYLSLRTDVPSVLVSHDIAYHHFPEHLPRRVLRYYQKYLPQFHQRANHIIAVSESTKTDLIQTYQLQDSSVSVAHNAVPPGFNPITEKDKILIQKQYTHGEPFFMYVGSLHPRKNIGRLIKGFLSFKEKTNAPHKLVLLGRKAWNFEEYEALIRDHVDVIYLDGSTHDPTIILPAAEALVYVSLHEGFGIPILEAMSAGVPVITSNFSSMPEVAGDAALLVNPLSIENIASGMQQIIAHPQDERIRRGFQRVKDFNWKTSAETIYRVISEVHLDSLSS